MTVIVMVVMAMVIMIMIMIMIVVMATIFQKLRFDFENPIEIERAALQHI